MAEERCEKHDMLRGQCGVCDAKEGPVWEAKYAADCRTCDARIEVGQKVKWTGDGLYPQHAHH